MSNIISGTILLVALLSMSCKLKKTPESQEKFISVATKNTCILDHLDSLDNINIPETMIKRLKEDIALIGKEKVRDWWCSASEINEKLHLTNRVHKDTSWHQPYIEPKAGYPVSKAGWFIAYGFADDCSIETTAKVELERAISRYLRLWLAELKYVSSKPIVDDFYYVERKIANGNIVHEGDKKPHLNVVFHCNASKKSHFSAIEFEIDMYYRPESTATKGLYFLPRKAKYAKDSNGNGYAMIDLLRRIGQAFGLYDPYHAGQPQSVMGGDIFFKLSPKTLQDSLALSRDDGIGIRHLYSYFHQSINDTICFSEDYEYVVRKYARTGRCIPKHPLIFALKRVAYQDFMMENDSLLFGFYFNLIYQINDSERDNVDYLKINAQDDETGNTGLHYAIKYGARAITYGMRSKYDWVHILENLLDITPCPAPTNVCIELNKQNNDGQTALHLATKLGFKRAARMLSVKAGVDKNLRDKANKTALDYARESGLSEIVRLLD